MGHSLCSFILRQIPRRSPTHNAVYFTTTRLGGYNNFGVLALSDLLHFQSDCFRDFFGLLLQILNFQLICLCDILSAYSLIIASHTMRSLDKEDS